MCGRTACTLAPDDIQKACCFKDPKTKKFVKPQWRDAPNGGRSYIPSYNVCPTDITPVLVSGSHFESETSRIVQPMMWGLIPPWHKEDYRKMKLSTNNCRLENMVNSKLYKGPFNRGQRCVVLCDGFYEWQTTKQEKGKQPYFIHMPQSDGIKIEDSSTWNTDFSEESGWKGPRLLQMAALFDVWKSPEGDEIFSYTIITMESNKTLAWLHHRMPAILSNDEELSGWLDFGRIDAKNALTYLKPIRELKWYPVSTTVNNSRNKDVACNKPLEEAKKKESTASKSADLMKSWLQGSKRNSDEAPKDETGSKIPKLNPK